MFVDQVVEESQQWVVEIVYFEQVQWFGVVVQLVLGLDFEQFFQGVEFVGQGDEGVGQFGYVCFVCVYVVYYFQVGQVFVVDFGFLQVLWDDFDYFVVGG